MPDWDLIEKIHEIITALPDIAVSVQWIKGHQDDTSDDLPVPAQYNHVRADYLARNCPEAHYTGDQWYYSLAMHPYT
jgi:hypothetical protein